MLYSSLVAVATMISMVPSVLAVGSAHVVNNCGSEVYFASVAQSGASNMAPLPASGYSETYSLPGVGISIKLAPANATGSVTQFEFTWQDGSVSYDISNIDGNPFAKGGMSLTPSMVGASGYPTCQVVDCPAGQSSCSAAYNNPDDTRTMVCPDASDLTFVLCPGGASKRDLSFNQLSHRMHARQFK